MSSSIIRNLVYFVSPVLFLSHTIVEESNIIRTTHALSAKRIIIQKAAIEASDASVFLSDNDDNDFDHFPPLVSATTTSIASEENVGNSSSFFKSAFCCGCCGNESNSEIDSISDNNNNDNAGINNPTTGDKVIFMNDSSSDTPPTTVVDGETKNTEVEILILQVREALDSLDVINRGDGAVDVTFAEGNIASFVDKSEKLVEALKKGSGHGDNSTVKSAADDSTRATSSSSEETSEERCDSSATSISISNGQIAGSNSATKVVGNSSSSSSGNKSESGDDDDEISSSDDENPRPRIVPGTPAMNWNGSATPGNKVALPTPKTTPEAPPTTPANTTPTLSSTPLIDQFCGTNSKTHTTRACFGMQNVEIDANGEPIIEDLFCGLTDDEGSNSQITSTDFSFRKRFILQQIHLASTTSPYKPGTIWDSVFGQIAKQTESSNDFASDPIGPFLKSSEQSTLMRKIRDEKVKAAKLAARRNGTNGVGNNSGISARNGKTSKKEKLGFKTEDAKVANTFGMSLKHVEKVLKLKVIDFANGESREDENSQGSIIEAMFSILKEELTTLKVKTQTVEEASARTSGKLSSFAEQIALKTRTMRAIDQLELYKAVFESVLNIELCVRDNERKKKTGGEDEVGSEKHYYKINKGKCGRGDEIYRAILEEFKEKVYFVSEAIVEGADDSVETDTVTSAKNEFLSKYQPDFIWFLYLRTFADEEYALDRINVMTTEIDILSNHGTAPSANSTDDSNSSNNQYSLATISNDYDSVLDFWNSFADWEHLVPLLVVIQNQMRRVLGNMEYTSNKTKFVSEHAEQSIADESTSEISHPSAAVLPKQIPASASSKPSIGSKPPMMLLAGIQKAGGKVPKAVATIGKKSESGGDKENTGSDSNVSVATVLRPRMDLALLGAISGAGGKLPKKEENVSNSTALAISSAGTKPPLVPTKTQTTQQRTPQNIPPKQNPFTAPHFKIKSRSIYCESQIFDMFEIVNRVFPNHKGFDKKGYGQGIDMLDIATQRIEVEFESKMSLFRERENTERALLEAEEEARERATVKIQAAARGYVHRNNRNAHGCEGEDEAEIEYASMNDGLETPSGEGPEDQPSEPAINSPRIRAISTRFNPSSTSSNLPTLTPPLSPLDAIRALKSKFAAIGNVTHQSVMQKTQGKIDHVEKVLKEIRKVLRNMEEVRRKKMLLAGGKSTDETIVMEEAQPEQAEPGEQAAASCADTVQSEPPDAETEKEEEETPKKQIKGMPKNAPKFHFLGGIRAHGGNKKGEKSNTAVPLAPTTKSLIPAAVQALRPLPFLDALQNAGKKNESNDATPIVSEKPQESDSLHDSSTIVTLSPTQKLLFERAVAAKEKAEALLEALIAKRDDTLEKLRVHKQFLGLAEKDTTAKTENSTETENSTAETEKDTAAVQKKNLQSAVEYDSLLNEAGKFLKNIEKSFSSRKDKFKSVEKNCKTAIYKYILDAKTELVSRPQETVFDEETDYESSSHNLFNSLSDFLSSLDSITTKSWAEAKENWKGLTENGTKNSTTSFLANLIKDILPENPFILVIPFDSAVETSSTTRTSSNVGQFGSNVRGPVTIKSAINEFKIVVAKEQAEAELKKVESYVRDSVAEKNQLLEPLSVPGKKNDAQHKMQMIRLWKSAVEHFEKENTERSAIRDENIALVRENVLTEMRKQHNSLNVCSNDSADVANSSGPGTDGVRSNTGTDKEKERRRVKKAVRAKKATSLPIIVSQLARRTSLASRKKDMLKVMRRNHARRNLRTRKHKIYCGRRMSRSTNINKKANFPRVFPRLPHNSVTEEQESQVEEASQAEESVSDMCEGGLDCDEKHDFDFFVEMLKTNPSMKDLKPDAVGRKLSEVFWDMKETISLNNAAKKPDEKVDVSQQQERGG